MADRTITGTLELNARGVEILGNIGAEEARDALIEALDDPNERVVHYAAIALGKIGKPSVIPSCSF